MRIESLLSEKSNNENGSKETLTYTLAVISSLALYEYLSSVEGIVAECGLRTFSGIHR